MARREVDTETVEHFLDTIRRGLEQTSPALGDETEPGKHVVASQVIESFWYVHGYLLAWAQAHMAGYVILLNNPGLREYLEDCLGVEIDNDSHVLEKIGSLVTRDPHDDDCELDHLYKLICAYWYGFPLDEAGDAPEPMLLDGPTLRDLTNELLMSRDMRNSYWRMPIQDSLRALNEGEVDELATPVIGKRQGKPYSLNQWKLEALRQVRFRVGCGMKKYRALQEVGDGIGQSTETLRTWEKELVKHPDRANDLICSELAGRFRKSFARGSEDNSPHENDYGWHRGSNRLVYARYLSRIIPERTLDDIRAQISRHRKKESGG